MNISISEFAEERKVDRDTVNAWIRKHDEINKVCIRKGKDKLIDTETAEYRLLEKQYPLPSPIEIIEDKESRQKLIKAQEVIIEMKSKIEELQGQINRDAIASAQYEAQKVLLEDKQEQIERLHRQADEDRAERKELQEKIEALQNELSQEKAKSWLDKLLKK